MCPIEQIFMRGHKLDGEQMLEKNIDCAWKLNTENIHVKRELIGF